MIDVSDDYGIYNRFYGSRLRRQRSTQSSLQSAHVYRFHSEKFSQIFYFVSFLTHFPSTLFFMLIVKAQTWMFLAAFIDAWPLWLFATALVSTSVDLPTKWLSPENIHELRIVFLQFFSHRCLCGRLNLISISSTYYQLLSLSSEQIITFWHDDRPNSSDFLRLAPHASSEWFFPTYPKKKKHTVSRL